MGGVTPRWFALLALLVGLGGCDALIERVRQLAEKGAGAGSTPAASAAAVQATTGDTSGREIAGVGFVPAWAPDPKATEACQPADAGRLQALDRGEAQDISSGTVDIPQLITSVAGNCPKAVEELATALNNGGYHKYKQNLFVEATRWWRAGLVVRPASILNRYNLACGLVLSGKHDDGLWALEELRRAAQAGDERAAKQLRKAVTDNDLRAVRADEKFQQIVGTTGATLAPGTVPDGHTANKVYFVQGFKYQLRDGTEPGEAFLEARDNCEGIGMDLCSSEQWELMCSQDSALGEQQTWTTSYTAAGNLVLRGGRGCDSRGEADPAERSAGRLGICCERRAAIELVGQRGTALARSAQTYMGMVEDAMNSRDPQKALRLIGDEAFVYNRNTLKPKAQIERELGFDVKNSTEFSNRLVRCKSRIFNQGQEGEFVCDTVSSRKLVTRKQRELSMFKSTFRFAPPKLKYNEWGVGTDIVRGFKPVE